MSLDIAQPAKIVISNKHTQRISLLGKTNELNLLKLAVA
jgi:hypothetical protein